MLRTLIFGLLFICPPVLKPWILRVCCGAYVGKGVQIGWFASLMGRTISLGDYSAVRALTLLRCDGDLTLGRHALVSSFTLAYGSAGISLGDYAYIGPQCLINADEDVQIGQHSALGARCMVYTHGSFLPYTEGYWVRFGKVTVGNYVWCAAGVFLHPGVTIGDNSFINSRSVVSGELAPGTVAEGNPARQIATMDQLRRKMSPRRVDAAAAEMLRHFASLGLGNSLGIHVQPGEHGELCFSYRKHAYRIRLLPSVGALPARSQAGWQEVWLVSRPDWQPIAGSAMLYLDLIAGRMSATNDPIHHELALFLKRYYGVQLDYA